MINFLCKACGSVNGEMQENGRVKCNDCGKLARKKMVDVTKNLFHPELDIKPENFLKMKDIAEKDLIIYDVSDVRKSRKSKYKDSTSRLILFSFEEDTKNKKLISYVNNGVAINDMFEKCLSEKELPSNDGIEAKFEKMESLDGSNYWVMS